METVKRYIGDEDLSPMDLAVKNLAIKQLLRDYPNTPGGEVWISWAYDFVTQNPEDAERIMNSGEWDKASKFSIDANKKLIEEYKCT